MYGQQQNTVYPNPNNTYGQQQNQQYQQPQAFQMEPQYGQPQYGNTNMGVPPPPAPPGAVVQWMQRPAPIPNCPAGLEYLTQIDTLNVQQLVSLTEVLIGWETNNKYVVKNSAGQQVFYTFEETDACMRQCCGPQRRFLLHVVDNMNVEVLRISREFKCCAGCCWCAGCCEACSHEVKIEAANGEVLGYVKQTGSSWKVHYDILDENHNEVLKIVGPCCICNGPCCPCINEFQVMSLDGTNQVGKVCKEYGGFINEAFTKADRFSISFPIDMSVRVKSTLLGALFLIDFMFFEQENNNNN